MPKASSVARELLWPLVRGFRLGVHRARWREQNSDNQTTAENFFPIERVRVGRGTYGPLHLHFFGHPDERITIGSFCSIAEDVHILAGGEHFLDRPTTYPIEHYLDGYEGHGSAPRGPVDIADDVWIGHGCIILSGVAIGQGAVIGAGSVVARDVPPYAIFSAGRIGRYRLDDRARAAMVRLDWSRVTPADLAKNAAALIRPVDESTWASPIFADLTVDHD
jgi:acetyltransferase-like isoleucine patch superfamily enzyme